MKADPLGEIYDLQDEAYGLPYGPSKVALLEEAVRRADVLGDVDLAFAVRDELMSAATFSGRTDVMLVAFSWCLAQYDKEPERFDAHGILWKYKWVVENAAQFPEISRSRIEELLADMERRYEQAGSSMHAVYHKRRDVMMAIGDRQKTREAHAAFRKRRRDSLSDCPACVASQNCKYYAFFGQWRRALQAVQVVLDGRLSCAEEPHRVLSRVLLPLLRLGRVDEAMALQRRGYRLIRQATHFVWEQAQHLRFVALIGDRAQARAMLERHLPAALQTVGQDERFEFMLAARLWSERLLAAGTHAVKLRLPKELPSADADGKSAVRQLRDWFLEQAMEIGGRFDARNGNDYFRQQIEELPILLRLC